jgi:hypothetical protein
MNDTIKDAFYASPEGNGTVSYILNPLNAEQRLVFAPDSTIAVNQIYIKDLYGDSVPPVWVNHASIANANVARIGMGYGRELKINWTGTAGPAGLIIEVSNQSAATLSPVAPGKVLSASAARSGRQIVIRYTLGRDAPVSIRIFRINGGKIADIVCGTQTAGEHEIRWGGRSTFTAGSLIVEVRMGNSREAYKVISMK